MISNVCIRLDRNVNLKLALPHPTFHKPVYQSERESRIHSDHSAKCAKSRRIVQHLAILSTTMGCCVHLLTGTTVLAKPRLNTFKHRRVSQAPSHP